MTTNPFIPPPRDSGEYKLTTVQNQHQTLEFNGKLIGFATTETPESKRWTDIEIYATKGGNYVVHRVGVSVVYHTPGARCASGETGRVEQLDYEDTHEPCDQCRPGPLEAMKPSDLIRRETDRHSSDAVETPEELVVALSLKRPNGSTYLSTVARDALVDAANHDERIAGLTTKTVHIS